MGDNNGSEQLKAAMRELLDQELARKQLLQAAPEDITLITAFSQRTLKTWKVVGNNPAQLKEISQQIDALPLGSGTNFYGSLQETLATLAGVKDLERYSPAIVLMTDGEDNGGQHDAYQNDRLTLSPALRHVPIYCILFGDANADQLTPIAAESTGKVFDGRSSLGATFREVKGYN